MIKQFFVSMWNGHLRPILLIALIYLTLNLFYRIGLAAYSWDQIISPLEIIPSLLIGLIYDLAFASFFVAISAVFISPWPVKWINNAIFINIRLLLFCLMIFGILFLFVAESFFWQEFIARFNFVSVDYLIYRHEVTNNIVESYPVIIILEVCAAVALVLTLLFSKFTTIVPKFNTPIFSRLKIALLLVVIPSTSVLLLGQDLREFSASRVLNEIAGNGPYQFFAAFRSSKLDFDAFYATIDDEDAATIFANSLGLDGEKTSFAPTRMIDSTQSEKRLNVMFVVIESLSADVMAAFGNNKGLTPNLDTLKDQSIFYDNLFATGSRTTRGLEALSLSIPPSPGRSVVKRPEQFPRYNIATEFQNRDYDSAFFYGGRGYFDNMNTFFSTNGYRVIDQTDFNEDEKGFENAWGMADEYLFTRAIREADQKFAEQKPFFYFLLTTSNHRPFTFPSSRIDLPTGSRDAAIKYTDWAIGDFLRQAKQKPWFDDTVFVFVSDHCSSSAGKTNLSVRKHHIPMLMYSPKHIQPTRVEQVISQIDVAPTLLGLMNFDYQSRFIGQDALNNDAIIDRAFIGNYQHLGLYQDSHLTYLMPQKQIVRDINPYDAGGEQQISKLDPLAWQTISLYQAAERIEQFKLNAFKPKHVVNVRD